MVAPILLSPESCIVEKASCHVRRTHKQPWEEVNRARNSGILTAARHISEGTREAHSAALADIRMATL